MFQVIVWATDGSKAAAGALPYVRDLAKANGATVVVAHASEVFVGYGAGPVGVDTVDGRVELERAVEELRDAGVGVRLEIRTCVSGQAARCIGELANDVCADLVIVGTQGHSRLGGFLVGSVTQELLRLGECPVLAVPTHAAVTA